MGRLVDLTGKRFGRLVVIERAESVNKRTMWKCQCDCGNTKVIEAHALKIGETQSCGCLQKETASRCNSTHGLSNTSLYRVFRHIVERCYNQNSKSYKDYGGRGITVCDEWKSEFKSFYDWSMENGYKKGLEIDRIDNNKGYSPDNCRWVNRTIQANNRRSNRYLTFNGETLTIADWSRRVKIDQCLIATRIDRLGWSVEKTLTTKPSKRNR